MPDDGSAGDVTILPPPVRRATGFGGALGRAGRGLVDEVEDVAGAATVAALWSVATGVEPASDEARGGCVAC